MGEENYNIMVIGGKKEVNGNTHIDEEGLWGLIRRRQFMRQRAWKKLFISTLKETRLRSVRDGRELLVLRRVGEELI